MRNKKKNGFSLVEFMVVISIIGILTAGVFLNYREGQDNMNLQRTAYRLANDFRRSETLAGLKRVSCCPAGICPSAYRYSYGLHFDKTAGSEKKYLLFADCNGDNIYRTADDNIVEEVDLETHIILHTLNSGANVVDVVFTPPDPSASIIENGVASVPALTSGLITIKVGGTSAQTKTVVVNKVGMIEIN